jgi:cell division protein FtsB
MHGLCPHQSKDKKKKLEADAKADRAQEYIAQQARVRGGPS